MTVPQEPVLNITTGSQNTEQLQDTVTAAELLMAILRNPQTFKPTPLPLWTLDLLAEISHEQGLCQTKDMVRAALNSFGHQRILGRSRFYRLAKRGLDIVGSLVGLAILAMILPIIALLIWCDDRGPIFFIQTRVGQFNKPFRVYKFRNMIWDADYDKQHPEIQEEWRKKGKLLNDPRITRVGKYLRRTSLDELPQMLNVLRGEMSLVGPRPIQPSEMESFADFINLRQQVKPGLSGSVQVSYRSLADYEQRSILDYIYCVDQSLWLDLQIIIKTIPAVVRGVGAY